MSRCLLIAAAAMSALAASSAAAKTHPPAAGLPDFPAHARSGECWARVPVGPHAGHGAPSQSVWTLRKGEGPTATWSHTERPAQAGAHPTGGLQWKQVNCNGGRPFEMAHAAPAPHGPPSPPAPPPPPVAFQPPPMHDAPPPPPPMIDGPPAYSAEGPYADGGLPRPGFAPAHPGPHSAPMGPPPMAQHRFTPGPLHGPHLHPHHPHMAPHHPPVRPPHFAHHAPPRPPAAPWFGGRMLTWPGKSIR